MSKFLITAVISLAVNVLWADASESAEAPVAYRNPLRAMSVRYAQPVNISLQETWQLSPAQRQTATLPPEVQADARRLRFIYPEDREPTPEQIAAGAALTEKQRTHMRRARRAALREEVWRAGVEAELYNKTHSATLAQQEKKGVHILIRLKEQKGYYMDADKELRSFKVCSGKKSTPTPTGHFHVQEKRKEHRSNLYNNANMPYFMRLTMDGVGLHQGKVRSTPSSHGCVRMGAEDARFLFESCAVGTAVFIEE